MKRSIILLCMLLFALCIYNEKAAGKVQGTNKDIIEWESNGNNDKGRSLLPIEGYIEDGVVTIYLYACPEMVKIKVANLDGSLIYQNVFTSEKRLEIDLRGASGSFEIIVEYDELLFKGELRF